MYFKIMKINKEKKKIHKEIIFGKNKFLIQ